MPAKVVPGSAKLTACAKLYQPPRNPAEQQAHDACIRAALATLEMAIAAGHTSRSAIEKAARFKALRDEPEFKSLLEKLK